mmetsp:Transcript_23110/g.35657  ORF Transcript_23110/g.35657 Transcript_23110/m.35657 type:complete len:351 (-) Transcript_23110:130-1182(-)
MRTTGSNEENDDSVMSVSFLGKRKSSGGNVQNGDATAAKSEDQVQRIFLQNKHVQPTKNHLQSKKHRSELDWKDIFILGENPGKINQLYREHEFDFSHLTGEVEFLLKTNPKKNAFLFAVSEFAAANTPVVVVNVILMEKGYSPPEYVGIASVQKEKEEILPFQDPSLQLYWDKVKHISGVYILQCRRGRVTRSSERILEYALLYSTMPSKWEKEVKDETCIATFTFQGITMEYNKALNSLRDFIPRFCDDHGLNEEDHKNGLKEAMKAAFVKARADALNEKEAEYNKRFASRGYTKDVLNSVKVIKVYPQDIRISAAMKSPYVNRYFGNADKIVSCAQVLEGVAGPSYF